VQEFCCYAIDGIDVIRKTPRKRGTEEVAKPGHVVQPRRLVGASEFCQEQIVLDQVARQNGYSSRAHQVFFPLKVRAHLCLDIEEKGRQSTILRSVDFFQEQFELGMIAVHEGDAEYELW
jgi:hypothetical protein